MAWRETLLQLVGQGLMGGLTLGRWVRLLRENHFAVAPSCAAISCQVCYEELERDPINQVKRIYEALNLPNFSHIESLLQSYVESIAGYPKNQYPDLSRELRHRISQEWRAPLEEWGILLGCRCFAYDLDDANCHKLRRSLAPSSEMPTAIKRRKASANAARVVYKTAKW